MYLFFDTETNSLPRNWNAPVTDLSNWPRLVQLAWILYDEAGNELGRNDHIVKPEGFKITPDTANVHGITTEMALAKGVALQMVMDEFQEQVRHAQTLVAHNMKFDEKIMGAEFLRTINANPLTRKQRICTMLGSADYCRIPGRYGNKWPKLSELYNHLFNADFASAHNAAADIDATAKCFWELRRLGVM